MSFISKVNPYEEVLNAKEMSIKKMVSRREKGPRGWVIEVAIATESPLEPKWLKTVEGDVAHFCLLSFAAPDTLQLKK